VPAVFLQVLTVEAIQHWSSYRIDFDFLGVLLAGAHSSSAQNAAFHQLGVYLLPIAIYNLGLWFVSALLGYCASRLVFGLELDSKWTWLRFNNDWFLSSDRSPMGISQRTRFRCDLDRCAREKPRWNGAVLGMLDYYFLAREGGLESICLRNATRRVEPHPRKPEPVRGRSLVFRYSELLNLNVSFYKFHELPTSQAPAAATPKTS
jgi:hypothetical protein